MDNLDNHIEALLFLKGEPMTAKQLAKILGTSEKDVKDAIDFLSQKLSDRGIRLIKKDDSFVLTTSPDSSNFAKVLIEEEFNNELSKASLEVLSIIAYKGPVSRSEVDYIRGVNSAFTVRNLMVRGLAERIVNPKDSRSFLYRPSFQLLQHLGISGIKELPEFDNLNQKIESFISENKEETNVGQTDSDTNSDL
ncbi:MAG: SMC-Scp complex subunit ScpB [Candidatus Paceibacterota bacterium]